MSNIQDVKRLMPTSETLRELFLKSGNLCAYPGCGHLIMDANGAFIAQLCHIEAAEPGGPRFNRTMSNEDRRQPSNLMLMCYEHHKITDDESVYTVAVLQRMKADHEARFSSPDRSMLEELNDLTKSRQPTSTANLRRFNAVMGMQLTPEELAECVAELNGYISKFRLIPVALREFLGAVVGRVHLMQESFAVRSHGWSEKSILVSDLAGAFGLTERVIADKGNQLDQYRVAGISQIDTDLGPQPAIAIYELRSGWPLWSDLAEFCHRSGQHLSAFTIEMDFGRLDA